MQKLTHQLAGELGETLALAKFVSVGLHAYISSPGAPGHDIMVVTPEGPKSVEVKARQYINSTSEISRWPVDMSTKAEADYFLFIELNLRTFEPTFYLLDNAQARAAHKEYNGNGNCLPSRVRATASANDLSALTGEPPENVPYPEPRPSIPQLKSKSASTGLRTSIAQEAAYDNRRIVQYTCQSIDVFVDGILQGNAIENLRSVAKQLDVSERNVSGGVRNTRQLGKAVIEAIKKHT